MTITIRHYNPADDYHRVSEFLIAHYQTGNLDGNAGEQNRSNWLEPAWEYMHGHPYLDRSALEKIGLWEDAGTLVAVAHYESILGEAFFEFHPGYHHLLAEMLAYAEVNMAGKLPDKGRKFLRIYPDECDDEFLSLARALGYQKDEGDTRPLYQFEIPDPFPIISIPSGFRLTSLAEECNWAKLHRVLWRGFNQEGEPPMSDEELESRRKMFETPTARRDLKIAVAVPNGDFVAFCGMWFEATNRFAYIEPVATDPDYRRLGLGKAAVLEGIRRCGARGATIAYVGSDQSFYQAIGFKKVYNSECWVKYWE